MFHLATALWRGGYSQEQWLGSQIWELRRIGWRGRKAGTNSQMEDCTLSIYSNTHFALCQRLNLVSCIPQLMGLLWFILTPILCLGAVFGNIFALLFLPLLANVVPMWIFLSDRWLFKLILSLFQLQKDRVALPRLSQQLWFSCLKRSVESKAILSIVNFPNISVWWLRSKMFFTSFTILISFSSSVLHSQYWFHFSFHYLFPDIQVV